MKHVSFIILISNRECRTYFLQNEESPSFGIFEGFVSASIFFAI